MSESPDNSHVNSARSTRTRKIPVIVGIVALVVLGGVFSGGGSATTTILSGGSGDERRGTKYTLRDPLLEYDGDGTPENPCMLAAGTADSGMAEAHQKGPAPLSKVGVFMNRSSWLFPKKRWPSAETAHTCKAIGNKCVRRLGLGSNHSASELVLNARKRHHYGTLSNVCVTPTGGIYTFGADFAEVLGGPNPRFKLLLPLEKKPGAGTPFERIEYVWQDESGQLTNFVVNNLHRDRIRSQEEADVVSNLCFRKTTFVLQLFNPNLDVSCCNLGHILGKSLNAIALRQEYADTIAQNGGEAVQVFAYVPEQHRHRPKEPAAPRLYEFMQRMYAKKWVSTTAPTSTIPDVADLDSAICVPHMIFGLDRRVGHNTVRTTAIYPVSRELRREATIAYPNITVRPAPRAAKPYVITFLSRKDVGRRLILNENELLEEVRKHEISNDFIINVVEQSAMSPVDQAILAANTDVMVGTHGMALTWSFLMPPRAIVLEVSNYYRFGYNEGLNKNCDSVFGAHCGFFHLNHLLFYAPLDGNKGARSGNVRVGSKKFIEYLSVAKCVLDSATNDDAAKKCSSLFTEECGHSCALMRRAMRDGDGGASFGKLVGCALNDANETMNH